MSVLLPGIPVLLIVAYLLLRSPTKPAAEKKSAARHDPVREVFETVVFVVALVLMLKLFAVEAFVIPTGSMAETLYGYQKGVDCPECGHHYTVNSSNEVSPWDGHPRPVTSAVCPNCRHKVKWDRTKRPDPAPDNASGDRVLVHKGMYHWDGGPTRGDVVVFKFPVDPQVNHEAQNYIKRLWGLGGETLAVWRGDLYMTKSLAYPAGERDTLGQLKYPQPDDELRRWEGYDVNRHSKVQPQYRSLGNDFTYHNAEAPLAAFDAARRAGFPSGGGFEPLRKTDAQALAMRRLVYDNDHQAQSLLKRGAPRRWQADGGGWTPAGTGFTHTGGDLTFVRYAHRVPPAAGGWEGSGDTFSPQPITNFLGYNAGTEGQSGFDMRQGVGDYWVGDLMLEATADLSDANATVVLEVSRGLHRFRATFAKGEVAVARLGPGGKELARKPSGFTAGKHRLRFANFDGRLRVWVDGSALDLGPGADYSPADAEAMEPVVGALAGGAFAAQPDGHTLQNDLLAPASVGASGGVTVTEVKLWQDTFFTPAGNRASDTPDDPVDTFYVQPGHYLCLGDNSGQSSDSRKWGLVPERLMLGKACFVFFPFDRIGFIR